MALRGVGIDVVDVARFTRLVARGGSRVTARWFSPDEAAGCRLPVDFAAAFAAKEAVFKALGLSWVNGPVPWPSIRVSGGYAELSGLVGAAAAEMGVGRIRVDVTKSPLLATAVAIAELA